MELIISAYKKWKQDNPDDGYQYDSVDEFLDQISRGQLLSLLDFAESRYDKERRNEQN